ncbi:MAG: hypothetical protein EA392_07335 [Cryomorphaceae bacterium]|nr:MAG: hypothetical protein EA392_07335 [Cryomorphaceae bacterium]
MQVQSLAIHENLIFCPIHDSKLVFTQIFEFHMRFPLALCLAGREQRDGQNQPCHVKQSS